MGIHDDSKPADVVAELVSTITEGARQIGKADRGYTLDQLARVEEAVEALVKTLTFKKRVAAGS